MKQRPPDRRHLVIALTDGADATSFLDARGAREVALRADAVFDAAVTPRPAAASAPSGELESIAAVTGGRTVTFSPDQSIGAIFKSIISEFRTSYVLRYSAQGVPVPGWHEISVSLTRHRGYTVHAKRGYFGQ